ncbi:M16 family metallopeptidase [Acinetobacter sp. ANC 3813]|uniref:M16 family metallopeptidase n=1 Tax=Acinetobacter sp. ANC 3813 TaxID=1977873 RepID=UPI000B67CAE6|nr:pitrilysin family protein [Acinetobacter sp. ANC 3813]OTG89475.1 peptidase M16 [Acinetobacter sp. ANC 3813]
MLKISALMLYALLACATQSFAEDVDTYLNTAPDINDNPSQLQSIPMLQSLRNLKQQESRAPYVHDLKNRYKVRTLFVESQDLPMVDIQLTFNAGSSRDLEIGNQLYGLSNMAASLMDEGTEKYTANQIVSAFEQNGAQFSIKAYRDMFIVRLRVLSDPKKLEPALAMMVEVLKNSTFKNNSINMVLSNTQAGQKQLQENPSSLMSIQFYREIYGQHPYAQPITGTNGSLKKITTENLKQFRDKFLVAQNMNIAITGKLNAKEALKLSERIAGNIKQGEKAQPLPAPIEKNSLNIVHMPYNSEQAHVTFGHLGTTRDDPDRIALEIGNKMFGGGGFNAILMQELRVKRGYTYGAYSAFSFSQSPGMFSFSYSTRQDQLVDSIRVAHKALTDFVQQPIDRKQLEEVKAGMLRAYPNNYSSNASINAQLGLLGFYNQPAEALDQYPKQLQKITAEDVQKAIRKHVHPDQLTLLVVSKDLEKANISEILQDNLNPRTEGLENDLPMAVPQLPPATDAPVQTLNDMHASI